MTTRWARQDHLKQLADGSDLDVLIIGGGITGAGSALDAATRGLKVGLVERSDFASGTSSRSTKLLHGGIRYLPHFEFGLVYEGLAEQKILARTADYLYDPLEFLIPMYRGRRLADLPSWASHPRLAPMAMRLGLLLYDTLGRRPRGSHRPVSSDELVASISTLRTDDLNGGFGYMDAQTDDSRLVLSVLKTAVRRYGTVAANHVEARRVTKQNAGFSVELHDLLTGESFDVFARTVIAATGALRPPPSASGEPAPLRLSAGAHLIMNKSDLGLGDEAILLPETDDGRVIFIVPWLDMAMIGTTDTPYTDDPARPRATEEDIEYLMRHLRMYLDIGDVEPISAFSGLRALTDDGGSTADASREHEVITIEPGYVQVAGGKLTTYRRIAEETVDAVAKHLKTDRRSTTATEMLVGSGAGSHALEILAEEIEPLNLTPVHARGLLRRYGSEADEISAAATVNPEVRSPLGDGTTLLAEVGYAASFECASTIADFALRRTHLSWFSPKHGRDDVASVSAELAKSLGWSSQHELAEQERFETELIAEGL